MTKQLLIGLALLLITAVFVAVISSGGDTSASTRPTMQTITDDMRNGGQLIDVRTPAEYASGHIDGAINMPLQDIQAGSMPSAAKDAAIYVYCRSGNRSSQARSALTAAGYQHVIDLGPMAHVKALGGIVKP